MVRGPHPRESRCCLSQPTLFTTISTLAPDPGQPLKDRSTRKRKPGALTAFHSRVTVAFSLSHPPLTRKLRDSRISRPHQSYKCESLSSTPPPPIAARRQETRPYVISQGCVPTVTFQLFPVTGFFIYGGTYLSSSTVTQKAVKGHEN
jgi:hypothetical protein